LRTEELIQLKYTITLSNFIWMILKAQMQTLGDKTVISGLHWYTSDDLQSIRPTVISSQ